MEHPWIPLTLRSPQDGRYEAEAVVESGSPWYDGHFPHQPMLPGIALAAFAVETLRRSREENGEVLVLKSIKRVRFRKMISPGDPMVFSVRSSGERAPEEFSFDVTVRDELACSGAFEATIATALVAS